MKNNRWVLGVICALCPSVLVGVLGTCDLQNDEPTTTYYRLMATGNGDSIEIEGGVGYQPDPNFHRTYQGEGWWSMDVWEGDLASWNGGGGLALLYLRVRDTIGDQAAAKIVQISGKAETILSSAGPAKTCAAAAGINIPDSAYQPHPGAGSPRTVICTELHRQGLMDEAIFEADAAFGKHLRETQNEVLIGYHFWAKPVVRLMQNSRVFTQIVNVLAKPWSCEMAYRIGARDQGTFLGKTLMDVGVPVCRTIGNAVIWAREIGFRGPLVDQNP